MQRDANHPVPLPAGTGAEHGQPALPGTKERRMHPARLIFKMKEPSRRTEGGPSGFRQGQRRPATGRGRPGVRHDAALAACLRESGVPQRRKSGPFLSAHRLCRAACKLAGRAPRCDGVSDR